jgi:FlaA1/EpsC-like NDP-sugar epimerase
MTKTLELCFTTSMMLRRALLQSVLPARFNVSAMLRTWRILFRHRARTELYHHHTVSDNGNKTNHSQLQLQQAINSITSDQITSSELLIHYTIMKVLIIGATGNFGLRLIPALFAHGHHVVAFVRSSSKLQSLLLESMYQQISAVVEGSAKDSEAVKNAIVDNHCDAVINTAGLSAVAPWKHTDFPEIFRSVVKGVEEAGKEKKQPLRAWFLGGQGVLKFPGTGDMLSR